MRGPHPRVVRSWRRHILISVRNAWRDTPEPERAALVDRVIAAARAEFIADYDGTDAEFDAVLAKGRLRLETERQEKTS